MNTKLVRTIQSLFIQFGACLTKSASVKEISDTINLFEAQKMASRFLRVGSQGDGGYVLPDILDGIGGAISPGVGAECSFEKGLAERQISSLMIDASVDCLPEENARFRFIPRFLGPRTAGQFIDLKSAVCESEFQGDLILQIDIEGGEFPALIAADRTTLTRFRIIVLELHRISELMNPIGLLFLKSLASVLRENHVIVHQHTNSSTGFVHCGGRKIGDTLELTLVRRDFYIPGEPINEPSLLDRVNLVNSKG